MGITTVMVRAGDDSGLVTNGSGEVYDNAQTRLVVGTINLVEKIPDLARRPPPRAPVTITNANGSLASRGVVMNNEVVEFDTRTLDSEHVGNWVAQQLETWTLA